MLAVASAAAEPIKAIWIWEEDTFRLLDDHEWREETLSRLQGDGFNTLYLYADSFQGRTPISNERELYERTIARAHEQGFRVEALLGSAYLETNRYVMPDKSDDARAMIERVITYNSASTAGARFDAIHLDIEPYTLPEWKENRQSVVEYFVDAAEEWCGIARNGKSPVEIGAAIPFWFDGVERDEGTLASALQEMFDYVALMDYRDTAEGGDGIIEHARREIELASGIDRKVIIGIETGASELDKLTFAEEGRRVMNEELGKVNGAYEGVTGYGGIAVHHLSPYFGLKP